MKTSQIWHDGTPDATVELSSVLEENIVTEDVIQTVSTESIQSGRIDYYASWYPLGTDSSLVAA